MTNFLHKLSLFFHKNIIFILFLFIIIALISFNDENIDNYSVYSQNKVSDHFSVKANEKSNVDLSFVDFNQSFSSICFTFGKVKSAYFMIDNGDVVLKHKFTINKDGVEKCFNTGKSTIEDIKQSNIYFISSKKFVIYRDFETKNVAVRFVKKQKSNLIFIKYSLIVITFIIFFIVNYFINVKKIDENKFIVILLGYFLLLLFIIPPYNIPDEAFHFEKAFDLTQSGNEVYIPSNIDCLNYSKPGVANKVYDANDIKKCFKNSNNTAISTDVDNNVQSLFSYGFSAVGVKIADIFTNSPLFIFYTGRLFNFLISFLIVYTAIKITPKYKALFLVVSTMMMFVQQMISYSYDSILNASCLLLFAYLFKLYFSDEKISFKYMIVPIILAVVLLNIKMVYFPLLLSLFLIPKEKFHNKVIILLALIIAVFLWLFFNHVYADSSHLSNTSVIEQLNYLFANPQNIFIIIFNTFKQQSVFYVRGLVGYFGWFSYKVDDIFVVIYCLLFVYLCLSNVNEMSIRKRILLFICVFVSFCSIFAALYLFWSSYKLSFVDGVQGRYFIPLILPTLIVFIPRDKKIELDQSKIYYIINILLLYFTVISTVWYY